MAVKAKRTTKGTGKARGKGRGKSVPPQPAGGGIVAWVDDPMSANGLRPRPVANPNVAPLATRVVWTGQPPAPQPYPKGSAGLRYWTACDVLRGASDFWAGVTPAGTRWHLGSVLPVRLDAGDDLNAYYDRDSLSFFHHDVNGATVFSGESPDIVRHEFGHAVLDAVQPQLWDTALDEAAAFHESFGDMSALLCALQLDDMRASVLSETSGRIARSSSLSRLAEQLGWAIRQGSPQGTEPDCLRNASNEFYYRNPLTLPPSGPASNLTSEPHSFSRVFTGAFLEALAGMLAVEGGSAPVSAHLLAVSQAAGQLLIDAAIAASIAPSYYAEIASAMISADLTRHKGKYTAALRQAFVRRGILSLKAAFASTRSPRSQMAPRRAQAAMRGQPREMMLDGRELGLGDGHSLVVQSPTFERKPAAVAAALDFGDAAQRDNDGAVNGFVQDLVRRGRIDLTELGDKHLVGYPFAKRTHFLDRHSSGFAVRRSRFDCGFDPCCH